MSRNIKDEIEAAFAAGAMLPDWRRRLLASGMDEGGVDKVAADIAETHPTLEFVWSKEAMAFDFVLGGLLLCLGVAGLLSGEHHDDGQNTVAGGLLVLVMTAVVAVVCEYERRRRLQA
uniref:Uncharacterized protein n=1 Tax=Oryza punctata TaxID=4537 RepID=A0A0E0M3Q9_ORYPU